MGDNMALNPLHALALLPIYFKRPLWIDPLAITISSTFVDIEVAWLFLSGSSTTHGIWHSAVVAVTVYPLLVTALAVALEWRCPRQTEGVFRFMRWDTRKARYPLKAVYLCSLLGGLSHIFFDMWTHPDSGYILWPFIVSNTNPFFIGRWGYAVEGAAVMLSAYALFLWYKAAKGAAVSAIKDDV